MLSKLLKWKMAAPTEQKKELQPDNAARQPSNVSMAESARPNNLQRIAQKKQQVRSYPRNKKLEKLAVYSSCKVSCLFLT